MIVLSKILSVSFINIARKSDPVKHIAEIVQRYLLCDLIDERGIHPGFKEILEGVAELWCQSNEGEAATEGVVYNSERPVGRVHTANDIDILRDKEGLIRRVGIS